jgi:hypothetical protein
LTAWAAYERVSGPLSLGERLDVLFALLCATVVNVNRSKASDPKAQLSDFLISWDGRKPEMDPLTMRRNLYAATRKERG